MRLLLIVFLFFFSCKERKEDPYKPPIIIQNTVENTSKIDFKQNSTPLYRIKVYRIIPHDSLAFTQGLFFHNGYLYESTGQYSGSSLRKIDPKTGKILKSISIGSQYFSEGIALVRDKIYMLTWQNEVCFVFDLNSFEQLDEISYSGEGWGLTNYDEKYLIQSDGTNALKIIDPNDFKIASILLVFDNEKPVDNLNELELIGEDIWANIWMKDTVAVIDKRNGKVKFFVDLSSLRSYEEGAVHIDVLNGIAFDSATKRIFITGKFWHYIFEVGLEN